LVLLFVSNINFVLHIVPFSVPEICFTSYSVQIISIHLALILQPLQFDLIPLIYNFEHSLSNNCLTSL